MNLHGIVAPVIGVVNPNFPVIFEGSNGYTQGDDFAQKPAFLDPVTVMGQVQELTSKDLQLFENLNLQGNMTAIYLYGISSGVVRVNQTGGDRITIPTGPSTGVYKVERVLEQWPDWVKVAAVLQNTDITSSSTPTGPALGVGPP